MEGLTDEEVAEITGLRSGTVRVRLHRARLFVRKELMKMGKPRRHGKVHAVGSRVLASEPSSPPRCKAMFAELSNYLDEQLDDSLCEELEKHLDDCGPCQAFLASLQSTIESCHRLPAAVPDRVKAAKLRREVMSRYERAMAKRT
jgi:RNA polymerase sigma-70 factor (ECF subfamily)